MRKAQATKTATEGGLILQGELFWKWRASIEAISHVDADLKLKTHQIDILLEQQPELKLLLNDRAGLIARAATTRQEYRAVVQQLEDHFGFPMKDVSIDDISGRVSRAEVPIPPPSVSSKPRSAKAKKPRK